MPTTDQTDRLQPSPPDGAAPDGDGASPPPTRPPGPSVKLALIVFGIALGIFVVSIVAELATGAGSPTNANPKPETAQGAGLTAVAPGNALAPLEVQGQPPDDVMQALVLPQGVRAARVSFDNTGGTGPYDRTIDLTSNASQGALIQFYRAELKTGGWGSESSGPATNATNSIEVLAQRAGSDGYYWEVGVIVPPTSFGPSGAPKGTTHFTLRLYQVSDSQ